MSGQPLKLLLVEDNSLDAELLIRELVRGGYEVQHTRVETLAELDRALDGGSWDLVISDFSLPGFGAPAALARVKARRLDLPFIIISGTVDEEAAVEAMRAGAHDFISKGRMARLLPAIERELRESAVRTERKRMQEQLVITDRMASVGTMAAGVAHEINNPLAALIGNLEVAHDELQRGGDQERVAEALRDAREATERVRAIVRDLKIFSRDDAERRGPVDLRRVIESSVRMAWTEIRHRAKLVADYGQTPPVMGNEMRLGQVFLNLLVNAAQALPDGKADRHRIEVKTWAEGDRVLARIKDTGPGIPEAIVGRIFDPFFTTKPVGVGTGLGLAICQRVVQALGGQITVETKAGEGTAFTVSLPAAGENAAAASAPRPSAPSTKKRGRILVIDDEVMVAAALKRMLQSEHDVTLISKAREALQQLEAGERYDVILCDLMMPEMNGVELHGFLESRRPDLAARMVFMTGGAFSTQAQQFLERVKNPWVEKPFDLKALKQLIQSML